MLGSDAQVRVQGTEHPSTTRSWWPPHRSADAIAEVTWEDAERRRALVHCYIGSSQRVVNRELLFDEADEPRERGRMLGSAIASMLPEAAPVALSRRNTRDPTAEPTNRKRRRRRRGDPCAQAREQHRRAFGAVDASRSARSGSGVPARAGVGVSARWFFHRGLSLRLVAGVRHGDVPAGASRFRGLFGGVGSGFSSSSPDPSAAFVFGGRTDALLESYTLRRRASDGAIPERQTQLMPAADLLLKAPGTSGVAPRCLPRGYRIRLRKRQRRGAR